jgi:hypothetical protein
MYDMVTSERIGGYQSGSDLKLPGVTCVMIRSGIRRPQVSSDLSERRYLTKVGCPRARIRSDNLLPPKWLLKCT